MLMKKMFDYNLIEKISEQKGYTVYRAKKENEEVTVLLKILKAQNPSPLEVARFKQEYETIKSLDLKGVFKISDVICRNETFGIVEEAFNGENIKIFQKNEPFSIKNFLNIGIKLSETLGYLHKRNISHRNIKPHNILIKYGYLLYFKYILPFLGEIISKSKKAYSYLPNTVLSFPQGEEFINILQKNGFTIKSYKRLSMGIASVYIAMKN